MVAVTRSKLSAKAVRVEADLWVDKGRAYRKVGNRFACEGTYKPPRSQKASRRGKLSEEDASYIKSQLDAGANGQWLRRKFEVSAVTIHNIGKGKIWKDLEPEIMELEGPPRGVHKEFWDEYLDEEEIAELNLDEK